MRKHVYSLLFLVASCTLPEEKKLDKIISNIDTASLQTSDTNTAQKDPELAEPLPLPKKIKNPTGIYQTSLPFGGGMEQTIAFYKDLSYRLQEKYNHKDSIVVIEGNWTPSDGYIWLYKDQVVRGRYTWKGNELQYFSPLHKKNFSMHALKDVMDEQLWQDRKKQGIVLFGLGNEPFWNVQYNNRDSISFLVSDWSRPLEFKLDSFFQSRDSLTYIAHTDTSRLIVTAFPYFCTDGMSEYVYRNKIRVRLNNQTYTGCGVIYK